MSKELEVAIKAAKEAGKILDHHFETTLEHEHKEDRSIVTKADIEADEVVIDEIQKNFPDHQIHSEERGIVGGDSEYVWAIDPLDGTMNFVRGIPIFSTSIALLKGEDPIVAVIYNPITNSLFTAEKGKGALWNNKKIEVSKVEKLSDSVVSIGRARDKDNKQKTLAIYNKLYFNILSQRVLGSAALELAYTASGRLEGFISVGLKKWDVAAGLLLISEAGGKITDYEGGSVDNEQNHFIATNGRIHGELLDILKE